MKTIRQFELRFEKYDLVICDEFEYVSCDKEGGELLFNHFVKDKVLVAAMVDRLTHKAFLINMAGISFSVKDAQNLIHLIV